MKRIVLFLGLLLAAVLPVRATNTLIGGTWKDASGVLINGSITAQLAVTALDSTTSQTVTTRPVTFRLLNGTIQSGAFLVDTANMQPQNDYYIVTVTDEAGNTVMRGNYVIPAVSAGTVYPMAAAVPTVLTTSSVYYPQVNIFTGTPSTVNPNLALIGPAIGPAAIPTFRALVGADLPLPTSSTLGGVQSKALVAHNFLTQISTAGVVSQAQPAFGDLSDTNAGVTCTNALTYNSGTHTFGCNVTAGTGTVTSVALALPGIFTVSGSPVVSNGTLTGTLATQAANTIWSGPTAGGAVAPTFRSLVSADIPTLDFMTKTSGNVLVSRLNSGNNASSGAFWRGDGLWTNLLQTANYTSYPMLASNADMMIVWDPAAIGVGADLFVNGANPQGFLVMSTPNRVNFVWDGSNIQLYVDDTLIGAVCFQGHFIGTC